MKTQRTDTGIAVQELTDEEAELLMTAAALLAEATDNETHARILRRACIQIDRKLPKE